MTEEEKAAEKLRKEVEWADKYGWQSFRVPKERIRTLLAAYERRGEVLKRLQKAAEPAWPGVQSPARHRLRSANTVRPEGVNGELALHEAVELANALWLKHYRERAPHWRPLEELRGVISQIDNMTAGLVRLSTSDDTQIAVDPRQMEEWLFSLRTLRAAYDKVTNFEDTPERAEYQEALAERGPDVMRLAEALLPTSGSTSDAVAGDDLADRLEVLASALFGAEAAGVLRQAAARLRGEGR